MASLLCPSLPQKHPLAIIPYLTVACRSLGMTHSLVALTLLRAQDLRLETRILLKAVILPVLAIVHLLMARLSREALHKRNPIFLVKLLLVLPRMDKLLCPKIPPKAIAVIRPSIIAMAWALRGLHLLVMTLPIAQAFGPKLLTRILLPVLAAMAALTLPLATIKEMFLMALLLEAPMTPVELLLTLPTVPTAIRLLPLVLTAIAYLARLQVRQPAGNIALPIRQALQGTVVLYPVHLASLAGLTPIDLLALAPAVINIVLDSFPLPALPPHILTLLLGLKHLLGRRQQVPGQEDPLLVRFT